MKRFVLVIFALILTVVFVACSESDAKQPEQDAAKQETQKSDAQKQENLEQETPEPLPALEDIDFSVSSTLVSVGYSVEHASQIQQILLQVGVTEIKIDRMTGEAETGLNSVVCFPNGESDSDRRFYFTTEDGALFYAGFGNEDLYDSDKGGFLKSYADVHVPETEVTVEVYELLRQQATEDVKLCLSHPDTADFSALSWGIGRSDDRYKIIGSVTAKNSFGVEDEVLFSVWYVVTDGAPMLEGIALNGIRVK